MNPSPGETRSRLLVVDDDAEVRSLLCRYLGANGFHVGEAADAVQARAAIAAGEFDLVLLDLSMPGEDGLSLARHLREHWHGAVIIVSGRGDAVDRIVGLEIGADDYVSKPFDLRELLARVRSVLRRASKRDAAEASSGARRFRFEGWLLEPDRRRLQDVAGAQVELTSGEFELLLALVEAKGRVCSRDQLIERLHGRQAGPFDRVIDVQVGRLRQKIERDAARPRLIRTVRGAGYMLGAEVETA